MGMVARVEGVLLWYVCGAMFEVSLQSGFVPGGLPRCHLHCCHCCRPCFCPAVLSPSLSDTVDAVSQSESVNGALSRRPLGRGFRTTDSRPALPPKGAVVLASHRSPRLDKVEGALLWHVCMPVLVFSLSRLAVLQLCTRRAAALPFSSLPLWQTSAVFAKCRLPAFFSVVSFFSHGSDGSAATRLVQIRATCVLNTMPEETYTCNIQRRTMCLAQHTNSQPTGARKGPRLPALEA